MQLEYNLLLATSTSTSYCSQLLLLVIISILIVLAASHCHQYYCYILYHSSCTVYKKLLIHIQRACRHLRSSRHVLAITRIRQTTLTSFILFIHRNERSAQLSTLLMSSQDKVANIVDYLERVLPLTIIIKNCSFSSREVDITQLFYQKLQKDIQMYLPRWK